MLPTDLPDFWRDEAKRIRERYADAKLAALCEAHAKELERALNDHQHEPITRNQLAAEIGCHPDSITRAALKGKIRNIGTKGAPRFRRSDIHALKMHLRGPNDGEKIKSIAPSIVRQAIQSRR